MNYKITQKMKLRGAESAVAIHLPSLKLRRVRLAFIRGLTRGFLRRRINTLAGVGYFLLPLFVVAQVSDIDKIVENVGKTFSKIITLLFVLATLVFLWGVIQFIGGSADPSKRDKAKGIMTWGIIGLAVMAAAWGITSILINYFLPGGGTEPKFVPVPTFNNTVPGPTSPGELIGL